MRLIEASKAAPALTEAAGTKDRILAAAVRLFSEHGFDAVSVRDITAAAGVNGAAISYHFGSKEQLVGRAFSAIVGPINEARLRRLDKELGRAGDGPPRVDRVVQALVEPVIASAGRFASTGSYHRFHILAYALRRPYVDEVVCRENDPLAVRFVDALSRALPHVGKEEIWWRYDFMLGALVHILLDADRGNRLQRLSGGACDTNNSSRLFDQLTAFVVGGLAAAAPDSGVDASSPASPTMQQSPG